MATYLEDFVTDHGNDQYASFEDFLRLPVVAGLGWPVDVVEQWLWDHGSNGTFIDDYGHLDLERIGWRAELVGKGELAVAPTGASDGSLLEDNAREHEHWLGNRKHLPGIVEAWEKDGTWIVPPVLVERSLLEPGASGLQVVEGRTRVGILRGRLNEGLHVAGEHLSWVGRNRDVD